MARHFINQDDAMRYCEREPVLIAPPADAAEIVREAVTAPLVRLLFDAGIACAGGEARRYISSGIIAVDGVIVTDIDAVVPVGAALSVVKRAKEAV